MILRTTTSWVVTPGSCEALASFSRVFLSLPEMATQKEWRETLSPEVPLSRDHSDPDIPHLCLGSFSLSNLLKDPAVWRSWAFMSFRLCFLWSPRIGGQGPHSRTSWGSSCYWPWAQRPHSCCTSPVGEGRWLVSQHDHVITGAFKG